MFSTLRGKNKKKRRVRHKNYYKNKQKRQDLVNRAENFHKATAHDGLRVSEVGSLDLTYEVPNSEASFAPPGSEYNSLEKLDLNKAHMAAVEKDRVIRLSFDPRIKEQNVEVKKKSCLPCRP